MLKKILTYRSIFLIIIHFSFFFNFFFFKDKKIKNKIIKNSSIIKDNFNQKHINASQQGKKINLIIFLLEIESFITNILKIQNINNALVKNIFNINFYNLSHKEIILIFFKKIYFLNKRYNNLSYLLYLIILNKPNLFGSCVHVDFNEKIICEYLKKSFILKNLTVINFTPKEKEILIKDYFNRYNDFFSLKNCEIATEHSVSNINLLQKIKKKLIKIKKNYNFKRNNPKYLGMSLYAFGHLLNLVDIFHRSKNYRNVVISPYYIANSFIANYLRFKYPKYITINHKIFLKVLLKRQLDFYFHYEEIDNYDSIYQLSYSEFLNKGIVSPSIDIKIYLKLIKKLNIKLLKFDKPYVCLILRNDSFKTYDKSLSTNLDRYSLPNYLEKFIYLLNDQGFNVVLLNGKVRFKKNNPKFFDYANSSSRNNYDDINLIKDCSFIINFGHTSSGAKSLLFNKYSLNIDYPFNRKPIFDNLAYFVIRPMFKKGKKLLYNDYFNKDLYINHDYKILKDRGYTLGINSFDEVLCCFNKFLTFYKMKIKSKNLIYDKKKSFYYPFNIINSD